MLIFPSPVGFITIYGDEKGLSRLEFSKDLTENITAYNQQCTSLILQEAKKQLEEYFAGQRQVFDLTLRPIGTEFQQKVWQNLQEIPYATTISYKQLAANIGNKKSFRAVGNANSKNPLPIIIPCHRVIKSSGNIGGYSGGLAIKEKLLLLENHNL